MSYLSHDQTMVKLRLSYQDSYEVMHLAQVFYKKTERLILVREHAEWFVMIPVESYLQRLDYDYTMRLGQKFFVI